MNGTGITCRDDTEENFSSNAQFAHCNSFTDELDIMDTTSDPSDALSIIHQLVPQPAPPTLVSPTTSSQPDRRPSQKNERNPSLESIPQSSQTLQLPWCRSSSDIELFNLASSFVRSPLADPLVQPALASTFVQTTPAGPQLDLADNQQDIASNESTSDKGHTPTPENSDSNNDSDYYPDGDSDTCDLPETEEIGGTLFSVFSFLKLLIFINT